MRGRQLFHIAKLFLLTYSLVLRILPACFAKWLLVRVRYVRGIVGLGIRYGLVHRLAKACGDNVAVDEAVFLEYVQSLTLGKNVRIHPLCYIDAQGGVSIGSDVSIAHGTSILSFEHDYGDTVEVIKNAPLTLKEVVIEDNVWIGAGVRILGGARVGTGTVIGAGAVVTKDIPPMSVAVGVPAHVIKSRKPRRNNSVNSVMK